VLIIDGTKAARLGKKRQYMGYVVFIGGLRKVLPQTSFRYLCKLAVARGIGDGWLAMEDLDNSCQRNQGVVMHWINLKTRLVVDYDHRRWRLRLDPSEIMFNHRVLAQFEDDHEIKEIFESGEL
jgi:hypothetical protein